MFLPNPFVGEIRYPNQSTVIPNIAIDIIPFIFPLHRFRSVSEYMLHAIRPGQRPYAADRHLRMGRRKSTLR